MYPKINKGLKCFVDADFARGGQRKNLTIQPQYIQVQDILLSIGIVQYYGRLNYNPVIFFHNKTRINFTVTGSEVDHTNDGTSRIIGKDVEH